MDITTVITLIVSVCIIAFGVVAVAGSLYGILIWYPAYRRKKVDALKASGRQGRGTILRVPDHNYRDRSGRHSLYTMVTIGLEIDVPGIDVYQVDKMFTFPTNSLDLLEEGKTVDVWIDPKNPRDLDKIVINVK
ncbi:MAG: hypothetical protein HYZ21_11455 [Chloroflexi bacterium]|nr:hypothetical protein [Chloroflexota bacterium]